MEPNQVIGPPLFDSENKTSRSMQIEMMQQLSLMDYKLSIADEQRKLLFKQLGDVQEQLRELDSIKRAVEDMEPKVDNLETIRIMGQGQAYLVRAVWLVLAAFIGGAITYFTKVK